MRKLLGSKSVLFVALVAAFSPSIAFAVIDISSVTTALTEVGVAGLAIGAAFIIMLVAMKTFKWVRKAL